MNSNNPGYTIIKLTESNTVASLTFNQAAKIAASDQKLYLQDGSLKLALSAEPASHVLTFGGKTLTYSDDDGYAVTLADAE